MMNAENESELDVREIMGIMMALAAMEASVTDSDVAEFEKRLYVYQPPRRAVHSAGVTSRRRSAGAHVSLGQLMVKPVCGNRLFRGARGRH